MAYENQIKCKRCGKSIPDVHEDADKSALLCDLCYEEEETWRKPMKTIKTAKFTSWDKNLVDLYPIEIRSVDAWRESEGCWSYNDSFVICREECKKLLLSPDMNNRKLLKFLRDMDILSLESKGRVKVFEYWPYVEIQLKGTSEPIIQIYFDEENKKELYI
jgi:hypothetical protein